MCDPILVSEFVEQIKKALEVRPRTSHERHRPARISEGFLWLWVAPHSASRSTPERDISGGGCFGHFYIFPKEAAVDKAAAADLKGA